MTRLDKSKEWYIAKARVEGDCEIGAGVETGEAERCRKDGGPCFVGAGTDEAHWRCGTVQCGLKTGGDDGDRELRSLRAELDAISAAIGTIRFMDPPDGGDVPLAEQVRRMHEALVKAEAAPSNPRPVSGREGLTRITLEEVKLRIGEGRVTINSVLDAVNAILCSKGGA